MLKKLAVLPLVLAIAACSDSQAPTDTMPVNASAAVAGRAIPNRYVVVFKPTMAATSVAAEASRIVNADQGKLRFTYEHSIHGFAAPLGAKFPVPHGTACGVLLSHVIHANVAALRERGDDGMLTLRKYLAIFRALVPGTDMHGADAVTPIGGGQSGTSRRATVDGTRQGSTGNG